MPPSGEVDGGGQTAHDEVVQRAVALRNDEGGVEHDKGSVVLSFREELVLNSGSLSWRLEAYYGRGPWLFRGCALMHQEYDGFRSLPTVPPSKVQAWIQIHK